MPDQAMIQVGAFTWSRERELVPVYERLHVIGKNTDCLDLIEELCELKRTQMNDTTELLAALGVETPGDFHALSIPDDLETILPMLYSRETEVLEEGYLRLDPLLDDGPARTIMIRASRRKARMLALLREIAERCRIIIVISPTGDRRDDDDRHRDRDRDHDRDHDWDHDWHHGGHRPPFGREYVVQPGDTMFLIAQRNGIPLELLIRANPQIRNPDLIYPGDIIRIPVPGDHIPRPRPDHRDGGRRYVVREGDTIIIIAERFGITPAELVSFNPGLTQETALSPGQVLMIPVPGAVG